MQKDQGLLPEDRQTYKTTNSKNEETLDSDYYSRIMKANDEAMTLDTLESRITYESISSGVNLEYILSGEKLKENIILSSAASNKPFVYDCLVTGLVPELVDNQIYFKNSSGETILYMPAPYMYDVSGIYSDAVALGLETSGNGWKITINADSTWLADAKRVYPVVIDPVLSSSIDREDIIDASVWSNYPDTNLQNYSVLSTGYGSNTGDNRSFLKFQLPTLNSADVVVGAELVLTSYTSNGKEAQVNLHKVFDAWDSGTITWNNKPDYHAAAEDYVVFTDSVGTDLRFDITDIVKGWYRGETNNGVMIKDSMEESNYREYLSSDCSDSYANYRPRIYVSFVNATGLENYWTYHSQSIGRAGTVSINDYTGNLVLVHGTASTNGLNMPVSLNHIYNTNDKDINLGYGYGFRLNYLQTVTTKDSLPDYKIYTDGDGTKHYFYYDDNIAWVSGQRVYYGYASSAYINKDNDNVTTQKALINTTTLNVRAGAGTGYSVIATATKDMEVQILQSITSTAGQTWYMIHLVKADGSRYTGCVLSNYVLTQDMMYDKVMDPPAVHGGELDNNVMMFYGNPGGIKRASQTIAISGSAGDAFMANAWGIGYSMPVKDSRSFGIEVQFTYTDGTTEAFVSNFNDHSVNWLFLSDVFIAKKDYSSVKASYIYGYNENVVYFDGLSLYKEDYGVSYVYDDEGNVISTTDAANKSNSFEYDANNNMTRLVDAKGSNFTYGYDDNHNVTSALSAAGVKYKFTYNELGLPTESRIEDNANSSNYIRSSASYYEDGSAMASVTDPLGNTVEYVYDTATGRLLNEFDAKLNNTSYTYDELGRMIEVVGDNFTAADGHSLTAYVSYAYSNDNLSVVGWHGNVYRFTYDGFGNKQSVTLDDRTLITYTYGVNNGNLGTVIYGNGAAFTYTYDDFDRVTKVRYKASASGELLDVYTYEYRKDGSLAGMCDIQQNKTYKYFYDLSDRLMKVVVSDGTYYIYTYDANNNLVKVEEGNGTDKNVTEYTYDQDNRETSTKTNGKTYSTTYDALGRITKLSWDTTNVYDTNLTYNAGANGSQSAQLKSINNDGDTISYTYDANGNIVTITDSAGITKYYYDEMDQMYREDNHLTNQTVVYTYDAAGNILSKKIYAKTDAAAISGTPTD